MSSPADGWIVEHGIGESRAARLAGGIIVETFIEPEGVVVAGTIVRARLAARFVPRGEALVVWDGGEALVRPIPRGLAEGATLCIEITRPPLSEPGKPKRARGRPAPADAVPGAPPPLEQRLSARVIGRFDADLFGDAGWDDVVAQATDDNVPFVGGTLQIALTPAMVLIDVDGEIAPAELAVRGAAAAAEAIARLDLRGSIGIDLPDAGDRAARIRAAEAIDTHLPAPFERTAVNGFGFVQIVRPRMRASLPELLRDPVGQARALLRRIERSHGHGPRQVTAHPSVTAAIAARPDWIERATATAGAPVVLQGDPALAISGGHVQARFP